MSATAIARKYAKYIGRARPDHYVRHHKNMGHVGKEPKPVNEGTVTAMKAEQHRKSVDERIDELYKLALDGCEMAKNSKDTRGLASCIAQGIAATELMGRPEDASEKSKSGLAEMREAMRNGMAATPRK